MFDIRHDKFCKRIDDLRRDRSIEHLVGDSLGIRLKLMDVQGNLAHRDGLCRPTPKVQEWLQDIAKRNVNKGRKCQSHIRGHKVEDKLLLDKSRMVCWERKEIMLVLISRSYNSGFLFFVDIPSMVS